MRIALQPFAATAYLFFFLYYYCLSIYLLKAVQSHPMSKADQMKNQPAQSANKKAPALYAEFRDPELLKAFKKQCLLGDVEIRDVVERMVSGFMDGSIKIDISDLKKI